MMIRWSLFISLLGLATASAAPLEYDLGMGLVYCRVHALPADLPAGDSVRGRSCTLDIRYVRGGSGAAEALAGWLKFHSSRKTPVFLLTNAETSSALLSPFASANAVPGLIILGPDVPGFEPDIAVRVTPKVDRLAYDALEHGAAIETLIADKRDKRRNDEAMLEREHLSDSAMVDGADTDEPAAPPPLLDLVLQRSVQLHRALLALKRL